MFKLPSWANEFYVKSNETVEKFNKVFDSLNTEISDNQIAINFKIF